VEINGNPIVRATEKWYNTIMKISDKEKFYAILRGGIEVNKPIVVIDKDEFSVTYWRLGVNSFIIEDRQKLIDFLNEYEQNDEIKHYKALLGAL
jgi:hypothetical protein